MMQLQLNDPLATERAKEIVRKTLAGDYDPLLACRDLADLRERLPGVPAEVMDTFIGIASEVDGLPIGSERKYWAAEALRTKDIEAADYRERIRDAVEGALQQLLVALPWKPEELG